MTRDIGRLVAAVTDDEPETRAVLVGSQIVGLALARHVVHVEPLASLPAADVIDYIAPVFQHYLVEPLRSALLATSAGVRLPGRRRSGAVRPALKLLPPAREDAVDARGADDRLRRDLEVRRGGG